MTKKIDVYQILLDIGLHIPGILLINPAEIDEKTYSYHKENGQIYGLQNDIRLDFGIGSRGNFRFAGITDDYLAIYDLVTKMISTAVDQLVSPYLLIFQKCFVTRQLFTIST